PNPAYYPSKPIFFLFINLYRTTVHSVQHDKFYLIRKELPNDAMGEQRL
ncbi:hypothetical protein HDF22_005330, partial [Mucilaginibacter lappiensis]|nr:hypothetical protein [Mucilaginibacter lappiensis]